MLMQEQGGKSQGFSFFGRLPNELFELVLHYSDFESIAALRLTSKANSTRCMAPAFKAYYVHQKTDLSEDSLCRLIFLGAHPQLGPAVTHLTVTAVCYDSTVWDNIRHSIVHRTPDAHDLEHEAPQNLISTTVSSQIRKLRQLRVARLRRSNEDTANLLANAWKRLQSLKSLNLKTRIIQAAPTDELDNWTAARLQEARSRGDTDWISLWADCSRVLDIVTQAMGYSEAKIESVSVFDECFGKVSSNRFDPHYLRVLQPATLNNFMASAANLTTLRLTFSTLTQTPDELAGADSTRDSCCPRLMSTSAHQLTTTNFRRIAMFLTITMQLESLTLHMYNTLDGPPLLYSQTFDCIADEVRLPKLRRLTLRGLWCTNDAMFRFLRAHPHIIELNLREIHLLGPLSSWERIFELLRQLARRGRLSKVYLENLFHSRSSLLPLNPKDGVFNSDSGQRIQARNGKGEFIYARNISSTELKNGIELAASTSTPTSTRGRMDRTTKAWLDQRREDYGPPRYSRRLPDW